MKRSSRSRAASACLGEVEAPGMSAAAKVIFPAAMLADPDQGPRCRDVVTRTAQAIHSAEVAAKHGPSRAYARQRFEAVADHAERLATALADTALADDAPALVAMIEGPSDMPWISLRQLALEARRYADRLPQGGGRQTAAEATGQPAGRLLCAMAARELLRWRTGRAPNDRNFHLAAICDALWNAAGGEETARNVSGDTDAASRWRPHLEKARRAMARPTTPAAVAATGIVLPILKALIPTQSA